jgi:flagellar biosynthesis repressor protein FlbT
MALRFDLLPFDQLHLGKCLLKNSHERAQFIIEGRMPILRAKDFLQSVLAATWLEKLYCCIQQMYLEEADEELQGSYLALAARSLTEDPTLYAELQNVDQLIASRQHYKALKGLKKFIRAEVFTVGGSPAEGYVPRYGGWKK